MEWRMETSMRELHALKARQRRHNPRYKHQRFIIPEAARCSTRFKKHLHKILHLKSRALWKLAEMNRKPEICVWAEPRKKVSKNKNRDINEGDCKMLFGSGSLIKLVAAWTSSGATGKGVFGKSLVDYRQGRLFMKTLYLLFLREYLVLERLFRPNLCNPVVKTVVDSLHGKMSMQHIIANTEKSNFLISSKQKVSFPTLFAVTRDGNYYNFVHNLCTDPYPSAHIGKLTGKNRVIKVLL